MSTLVKLEREEGLAIITLARPEAGNAMSAQLIDDIGTATAALVGDASVRAVLIKAQGKNFCVGGDLKSFAGASDPGAFVGGLAEALHVSVLRLAALDAPVVVAVQGAAAGAGLSLALCGDLVLAAQGASFTMAYSAVGLTADGGASWILPRLVGLRRAQEMAYMNRRVSAAEAHAWGMVTALVPEAGLREEALATARRIASGPSLAYAGMKRLLESSLRASLAEQLDAEARSIARAAGTADSRGAVAAFLEGARPTYSGT